MLLAINKKQSSLEQAIQEREHPRAEEPLKNWVTCDNQNPKEINKLNDGHIAQGC